MDLIAASGRADRVRDKFRDAVSLIGAQRTAVAGAHLVDFLLPGPKGQRRLAFNQVLRMAQQAAGIGEFGRVASCENLITEGQSDLLRRQADRAMAAGRRRALRERAAESERSQANHESSEYALPDLYHRPFPLCSMHRELFDHVAHIAPGVPACGRGLRQIVTVGRVYHQSVRARLFGYETRMPAAKAIAAVILAQ